MPGRRYIRLCPQHTAMGLPAERPAYLHRSCPACMRWLAEHPRDAALCRQSVPGRGAYHNKGAWLPELQPKRERKRA